MRRMTWTLVVVILALTGFSCSNTKEDFDKKDWTVLIYMNGDNSLSNFIDPDINQMEASQFDEEKMNIVVQVDYNSYAENTKACRYKIINDEDRNTITSPKIQKLGEVDSGDWLVVADFINWGMKKYPAEKYAVILWSHGNGWMPKNKRYSSFFPDSQSQNHISIVDGDYHNLFSSLNKKVDVLILDACNMQTMENLSELSLNVDYIVGSEEVVPDTGFPYDDLFYNWSNLEEPRDFAIYACESYYQSYQPGGSQNYQGDIFSYAISVVDMKEFYQFRDKFMGLLENNQDEETNLSYLSARENLIEFNDMSWDVDIVQFIHDLKNEVQSQNLKIEIDSLLSASNRCFIESKKYDYSSNYVGNATICFPENKEDYNFMIERYERLSLAKNTYWTKFLKNILN